MSEETNVQKPSLIGIVTSPVQQFGRIRERPLFLSAIIVALVLSIVGEWLKSLGVDVPSVEGEAVSGLAAWMLGGIAITVIISYPINLLITSAIHLLIAKIALATVSFRQLFSMNTYILLITALGVLLNGAVTAVIGGGADPETPATSLGSIMPAEGAMAGLWDSIEVFAIWTMIITALGLQKVAGFSSKLAWTIAIVFFVIGVIFQMISTAITGLAGV